MDKEYDFVVFGATGFTGKLVCDELQLVIRNQEKSYKWAIAGRNENKLENVLTEMIARQTLKEEERSQVGIIIAETDNYESLLSMCQSCKVILDCVGPYRLYGEQVVKAAIEGKADFLDISGEPEYLEKMELEYFESAKRNKVYVVGACGFDSIPSDMAVTFAKKNFNGTINSLECYFKMKFGPMGMSGAYGTYASLVHSFANAQEMRKFRKENRPPKIPKVGPSHKPKGIHWNKELNCYGVPFPGADVSIVRRSQFYLYKNCNELPLQYLMYMSFSGMLNVFLAALFVVVLKLGTLTTWGKNMLLQHPKFFTLGGFSKSGPTLEQIKQASFSFYLTAIGYEDKTVEINSTDKKPDKIMKMKVSGPEIGYATTPLAMIQAGITLLTEREMLPKDGGVYTTASAFSDTTMIERMGERGLKFEIIK